MFALRPSDGFSPVTRSTLITWVIAYAAFLVYAFLNTSGFLFIDHANLMIHEVGHPMFGWAGVGWIGMIATIAWLIWITSAIRAPWSETR